jgi:hypothetical protein
MHSLRGFFMVLAICITAAPRGAFGEDGAYTMTKIGDAALRLNTRTGAVSICQNSDGAWRCNAITDSVIDLQREIERLTNENKLLSMELDQLKKKADRSGSQKGNDMPPELPTRKTVDQMMDVLEQMVRRFEKILKSRDADSERKSL